MDNVTKAIIMGVSVLLVVVLIGVAIGLFNQSNEITNVASNQLAETNRELIDSEYAPYDNTEVNGSTVVSAIKKYRDEGGSLIVQVTTRTPDTFQYISTGTVAGDNVTSGLTARATTTTDITNAKTDTNTHYINPSAMFTARLARDANGVIRAIIFEQQ